MRIAHFVLADVGVVVKPPMRNRLGQCIRVSGDSAAQRVFARDFGSRQRVIPHAHLVHERIEPVRGICLVVSEDKCVRVTDDNGIPVVVTLLLQCERGRSVLLSKKFAVVPQLKFVLFV